MTICNQCGNCCEEIYLSTTLDRLREIWEEQNVVDQLNWYNAFFILGHWTINEGTESDPRYSCDMFDSETRKCKAHQIRPRICRDYPWYNKEPNNSIVLKEGCSFKEDQQVVLSEKR